jgi:hypothetical protein
MLDWVIQLQNTLILVSGFTDEHLIIILSDHDFLIDWSAHTILKKILDFRKKTFWSEIEG